MLAPVRRNCRRSAGLDFAKVMGSGDDLHLLQASLPQSPSRTRKRAPSNCASGVQRNSTTLTTGRWLHGTDASPCLQGWLPSAHTSTRTPGSTAADAGGFPPPASAQLTDMTSAFQIRAARYITGGGDGSGPLPALPAQPNTPDHRTNVKPSAPPGDAPCERRHRTAQSFSTLPPG